MAYIDEYEQNLSELKKAQEERILANIEAQKEQAKKTYEQEQSVVAPQYQKARTQTSVSSQKQAKTLAEYLANRGLTTSGAGVQSEISRTNALQRNLTDLRSKESSALTDIAQRQSATMTGLDTALADKYAEVENQYLADILAKRDEERQYQEQLRQYKEQQAYQQAQFEYQKQQDLLAQQNYLAELEYQKQQDSIANNLAQQELYYNYGGGNGNPVASNTVNTDYFSGELNPDANIYGTFSNGYQPLGKTGHGLLKPSGDTITFDTKKLNGQKVTVTQKIWKAEDGTKWYWDGTINDYKQV